MKQFLLVSVLIAATFCKITVRDGLPNVQLLRQDIVDFDLTRVFDLSKAKGDISYSTNVGNVFSDGAPFAFKNYDALGLIQPNWITAHENIVIAVYDNTKFIFQVIDTSGKKFLHYLSLDLNKFGTKMVCSSTAHNRHRGYIYLGCFDNNSSA